MGTEFLKIKESEDALEIIQNLFDKYYTLQSEEIAVEDAYGRVLSGDVYSRVDFPPFDKALKDAQEEMKRIAMNEAKYSDIEEENLNIEDESY